MINIWAILSKYTKYDGSSTAHADVLKVIKAHGCNKYDSSTAWCVLQVMAVFAENNALGMIGGINQRSKYLKAAAQKLGIWHDGGSGILPGDIVVYADKNGVPNQSEFAIGAKLNISGNYNGGTSRRIRAGGRRIAGYVRPKYAAMPDMNDLQITIAAVDVLLDVYGSGATRTKQLSVFGRENASRIQQEVDRIAGDENEKIFSMAVYAIAGHAGKDEYRKKRLGSFYEKTRKKINAIYDLRGKTIDQAAADVIAGRYRKNETRKLLLKFAGYDPQKVQDKVNEIQKAKQSAAKEPKKVPAGQKIHSASLISIFADGDRSKKSIDGLQGDSFVIKADQLNGKKKAIVLDTARYCAKWKIYKELEGVEDAIMVITHPHSDHMGQTANNLVEDGKVSHVYLPARATIHTDYLARYDALTKACSKAKVPVTQLRQGDTIQYGGVTAKVIFQQISTSKDAVNMRSLCLLFEIAGATFLDCGDHHTGTKESNLDPEKIGPVTIYDSSHHGLYTGDKEKFIKAIKPQWIIHSGWKSWPLGSIGSAEGDKSKQDAKTRGAQIVYQKYGNLIPGDICGRTEFRIVDGVVDVILEKNARQTTVKYKLDGFPHNKPVVTCKKAAFHKVKSMIPAGAEFV